LLRPTVVGEWSLVFLPEKRVSVCDGLIVRTLPVSKIYRLVYTKLIGFCR